MKDQILNLFASGMSVQEVLKTVDISEDYLKELLTDKEFAAEVQEKRAAIRAELIEQGYAKLEQKTLQAVSQDVEKGLCDTLTLLKVLETTAKNRILHRNPAQALTHPGLSLHIEVKVPQGADSQGMTIDAKTGQIVAIGERNMAGMPIAGVKQLFKQLEQSRKTVAQDMQDERTEDEQRNEQTPVERVA